MNWSGKAITINRPTNGKDLYKLHREQALRDPMQGILYASCLFGGGMFDTGQVLTQQGRVHARFFGDCADFQGIESLRA